MNVALFGGSFDPPHNGHLEIIDTALKTLDIDKLIVIPAYLNPFKTESAAPAELRLKWLTLLIDDSRVEVSDFEVNLKRPVPSIESVKHFQKEGDRLYFIIGADNLEGLPSWYAFEELDKRVTWVVATRNDITIDKKFLSLHVNVPISSTEIRKKPKIEDLPKKIATSVINYYKEYHAKTH
jgi:nicotinate-nucleotide adenylyltransferase